MSRKFFSFELLKLAKYSISTWLKPLVLCSKIKTETQPSMFRYYFVNSTLTYTSYKYQRTIIATITSILFLFFPLNDTSWQYHLLFTLLVAIFPCSSRHWCVHTLCNLISPRWCCIPPPQGWRFRYPLRLEIKPFLFFLLWYVFFSSFYFLLQRYNIIARLSFIMQESQVFKSDWKKTQTSYNWSFCFLIFIASNFDTQGFFFFFLLTKKYLSCFYRFLGFKFDEIIIINIKSCRWRKQSSFEGLYKYFFRFKWQKN